MQVNLANIKESSCEFCKISNFLPYNCKLCQKLFCDEHKIPENHNCEVKKNDYIRIEAKKKKKKCIAQNCSVTLNLTNIFTCKECGQDICLKHRHKENHNCIQSSELKKNNNKNNENTKSFEDKISIIDLNRESVEQKKLPTIEKKKKKKWFMCFVCNKEKKKKTKEKY